MQLLQTVKHATQVHIALNVKQITIFYKKQQLQLNVSIIAQLELGSIVPHKPVIIAIKLLQSVLNVILQIVVKPVIVEFIN